MSQVLKRIGVAEPTGGGWLTVVFVFLVALFFTWRFIPHVRRFALKVGWADLPNERRLNREPLPNAGGLALYAGVVLALVAAAFLRPILVEGVLIQVLAILLGGAWLVLVGFVDDQFGLPPSSASSSRPWRPSSSWRWASALRPPSARLWTPPWASSSPGSGWWASPTP
jgi:UDP-GlcNAc:undecaprenyl-phosphate GlcNAc-1-phosphate transferase